MFSGSGIGGRLITVSDILGLNAFENVRLITSCEGGGSREVHNVGILDCPPDYNEYRAYMPRELILTNLGFAYGNPEMAEKSLLTMIRRDVAAIAIKSVYEPPISERVREESAARGVPLYMHDGAYYEKVAYESLGLIRRDREGFDKGRVIDELLTGYDGDRTRKLLHRIAGVGGAMVQCFALTMPAMDKCSFFAMIDAVSSTLASVGGDDSVAETVAGAARLSGGSHRRGRRFRHCGRADVDGPFPQPLRLPRTGRGGASRA